MTGRFFVPPSTFFSTSILTIVQRHGPCVLRIGVDASWLVTTQRFCLIFLSLPISPPHTLSPAAFLLDTNSDPNAALVETGVVDRLEFAWYLCFSLSQKSFFPLLLTSLSPPNINLSGPTSAHSPPPPQSYLTPCPTRYSKQEKNFFPRTQ